MKKTAVDNKLGNSHGKRKTSLAMAGTLLLFGVAAGAHFIAAAPREKPPASVSAPNAKTVTIPIKGMT